MNASSRISLVEPLLAALETERHCRAPLLRTVLDELSECEDEAPEIADACDRISQIIIGIEAKTMPEAGYRDALATTRALVGQANQGPRAA